ncbi:class C sortase [Streptococcus equinus]|uniref:class C sortase n=1 Tax=Streptococcus equinus TaxID=1335 RepID=UPI000DF91273|nr:class C sortase [Streptococcus equinus]SUO79939.1 sortase SrtC2 [Streptococcus equinus]
MKKKKIFGLSLLLIGLIILSYPFVLMVHYDIAQLETNQAFITYQENSQVNLKRIYSAIKETTISTPIRDVFTEKKNGQNSPYSTVIDTNKVWGQIVIPSLGQRFDLYLDADYNKLTKGVATLVGTGAPLGIKGQRPIIAGHRITYNNMSFNFIPELKKGDKIFIIFLNQTLIYSVYSKEIIDEYDSNKLKPVSGQDTITLMTCTNAPQYNQRYLVNAKRVETTYQVPQKTINKTINKTSILNVITSKDHSTLFKVKRSSPYLILILSFSLLVYFGKKFYQLVKQLKE